MSKIKQLEQIGAATLQLDITDQQARINDTIQQAIAIYGHVDVLINNASYVAIGLLKDLRDEDYLAQFNTNVSGTTKVTRAILPHFRQRRSGTLLFIGSLSGWVGHLGVSAYASSKFAIEGIVEAISKEVAGFGITTLLIEPGRFRTKLLSEANMKPIETKILDYAEFSSTMIKGVSGESGNQPGDPVKLVEIIIDLVKEEGIAKGRDVPFRLPLGEDCYDEMIAKVNETSKILVDWKDVILSTNIETA